MTIAQDLQCKKSNKGMTSHMNHT